MMQFSCFARGIVPRNTDAKCYGEEDKNEFARIKNIICALDT